MISDLYFLQRTPKKTHPKTSDFLTDGGKIREDPKIFFLPAAAFLAAARCTKNVTPKVRLFSTVVCQKVPTPWLLTFRQTIETTKRLLLFKPNHNNFETVSKTGSSINLRFLGHII